MGRAKTQQITMPTRNLKKMTDQTQTPPVDKWLISEPGGPAGPFWGIVTQSGRVIALQIVERQHAEILRIMGNIMARDEDTIKDLCSHLPSIFEETMSSETLAEGYFINVVMEAILLKSRNE